MSFVLDNSVAMRWCFENAAHPYADGILNRLAAGEDALAPVLWFYEASAVLAREQNRGNLAAPKASEFIAELKALQNGAQPLCGKSRSLPAFDDSQKEARTSCVAWLSSSS